MLAALRRKDAFARNPFCWLTNPGDVADPDGTKPQPPDFAPLFTGQRAVLLECLQTHLAHRWMRSERAKGQIGDWRKMRQQGQAEFAALRNFLQAADAAQPHRPRAVRAANQRRGTDRPTTRRCSGPAGYRGAARRAWPTDSRRSGPRWRVPRQMETLDAWQERARNVGYFDEGYQASQMWKAEWEAANGDRVAARAAPRWRCSNRSAGRQIAGSRHRAAGRRQRRTRPTAPDDFALCPRFFCSLSTAHHPLEIPMSRAYRITVKESESRHLKAGDEICTQLEILEILPPEDMATLLKEELKKRGFTEQDDGTMDPQGRRPDGEGGPVQRRSHGKGRDRGDGRRRRRSARPPASTTWGRTRSTSARR